jgi:hypothetical protein
MPLVLPPCFIAMFIAVFHVCYTARRNQPSLDTRAPVRIAGKRVSCFLTGRSFFSSKTEESDKP